MPPSVLPFIWEADFPQFQQIMPELEKVTYAEWRDDLRKAQTYRELRNGSAIVPVSPEGFKAWLKSTEQEAHLELLWVFAEQIAP